MRQFLQKIITCSSVYAAITVCIFGSATYASVKVVGYYTSWNASTLPFDKIEYSNLTHIIIAFGTPNADGSISLDTGIPFPQLVSAAHSAGTKVLISLGGAGSGTSFSSATKDSALRASLIKNVVSFLQENNYDGVDIDWETPSDSAETAQLTSLIKEMRAEFTQVDSSWLITMAIPAGSYGGQYIDIRGLVGLVDWFNVMCYDFVGSWSTYAGHNSPLYQAQNDPNQAGSDSTAVVYWVSRGSRQISIPRNKLILGIPFYSVQFNAADLYQKLTNTTTSNPYYADVMNDLISGWTYHWDNICQVPYLTNIGSGQFITFEDTNSVKLKVEYALRQQLGGIMIWELSQDLYNGSQSLLETIGGTVRELTSISPRSTVASDYRLYENYPNPFNPTTSIIYQLSSSSSVTLKVYDVLGREVKILVNEVEEPGRYRVEFDASNLSGGTYFYRLMAGDFSQTKKMLLLK
ncbi:MAG TPA: glycosyl hydrolase family 18 protein [Candidatus Acidoferrales bacterium]|nr:glycosyl hydrolase family 18 protein [Candidatus Acidoferrales bacterium]